MKKKSTPKFSIIIPVLNEERFLARCLLSLRQQDYAGFYEIIVVDNGSNDRTVEIARRFNVKIAQEFQKGVSRALIAGCLGAKGEVLVFTDGDTCLPNHWLKNIDLILSEHPNASAVGGPYTFYDTNILIRLITRSIIYLYSTYLFRFIKALPCANMAVRRNCYFRSGGFDPAINWGQDIDLSRRLSKLGPLVFDKRLLIETSFRRYRGNHINPLMQFFHGLREFIIQTYRLARMSRTNKIFPARPVIRGPNFVVSLNKTLVSLFTIVGLVLSILIYGFISPASQVFGSIVNHGFSNKKYVALTFDDGPYGDATSQILDILKSKNVKATFFLVGQNALKYPDLVQREIKEGHLIGNHSFDHSRFLSVEPSKRVVANVLLADRAIAQASGGLHPRYFRPPYGLKSPLMIKALKHLGYEIILWNDATDDYDNDQSAEAIAAHITKLLKPGAIIDLHDGRDTKTDYPRDNLIKALPIILEAITKNGYTPVTLDVLLETRPYSQ